MRVLSTVAAIVVVLFAVWFFELRPSFACWDRGGSPVRGPFDNVVCVEAR